MTKKWFLLPPGHAALDDLRDYDKRQWALYEDSFGDKVHHVASGMTEETARLLLSALESAAEPGECPECHTEEMVVMKHAWGCSHRPPDEPEGALSMHTEGNQFHNGPQESCSICNAVRTNDE